MEEIIKVKVGGKDEWNGKEQILEAKLSPADWAKREEWKKSQQGSNVAKDSQSNSEEETGQSSQQGS